MDHVQDPSDETSRAAPGSEATLRMHLASLLPGLGAESDAAERCSILLRAATDALLEAYGPEALAEGLEGVGLPAHAQDASGREGWISWRRGLVTGFLGCLALIVPFVAGMFILEVVIPNPVLP